MKGQSEYHVHVHMRGLLHTRELHMRGLPHTRELARLRQETALFEGSDHGSESHGSL